MNRTIKRGIFACALAALAVQPALAQEPAAEKTYPGAPDPKSYGYTVLAVGIASPYLTLPWGYNWDVFGLDVNFLYSDCNKMYGIEAAGLVNVARLDMYGVQAALCFNLANRDAVGLTCSCFNLCNRTLYGLNVDVFGVNREVMGLSIDGIGAGTGGSFYGIEIGGVGSMVKEDMWGWQIALGANLARRVHGFQTAVLFNMTDDLRGAQLGLVNWASTCSAGFQIGLVNLIMDNKVPFIPIFNCYF